MDLYVFLSIILTIINCLILIAVYACYQERNQKVIELKKELQLIKQSQKK